MRGHAKRDARGIEAEVGHHRDIVAIAMVEIACDVAGIALLDFPGVCEKRSQIDSLLPSLFHAPSI